MPLKLIIINLFFIFSVFYFGCFTKKTQNQKSISKPSQAQSDFLNNSKKNDLLCYYKHFSGKTDNGDFIKINLNVIDFEINGNYFYTESDENFIFSGTLKNDSSFEITSTNLDYTPVEIIKGKIINDSTLNLEIKNIIRDEKSDVLAFEDYKQSLKITKANRKTIYNPFENDTNIYCSIQLNYLQPIDKKHIITSDIIEQSYFNEKSYSTSVYTKLDTVINDILADYQQLKKDEDFNAELSWMYTWEIISDMEIVFNDYNLLCYSIDKYEFTGGAHGTSLIIFNNIEIENQKVIELKDIFIENYEDKLLEIILQKLVKNFELNSTEKLNEYLFDYKEVEITPNFYLDHSGIGFVYNQYEIAPYALGQIYVFIPYSEISGLLQDSFVLSKK